MNRNSIDFTDSFSNGKNISYKYNETNKVKKYSVAYSIGAKEKGIGFSAQPKNQQLINNAIEKILNETCVKCGVKLPTPYVKWVGRTVLDSSDVSVSGKPKQRKEYTIKTKDGNKMLPSDSHTIISTTEMFSNISEDQVLEFINFLDDTPYLAMLNSVGKKIYKGLKQIKDKDTGFVNLKKGTEVYRTRQLEKSDSIPTNLKDFFDVPRGVTKLNRFNHLGFQCTYVCTNSDVAIKELKDDCIFSCAKGKLTRSFKVLDMTKSTNNVFDYCLKEKGSSKSMPREYLLPNFIANVCINLGIDGIKYRSVLDTGVFNYVLFNFTKHDIDNLEYIYTKGELKKSIINKL